MDTKPKKKQIKLAPKGKKGQVVFYSEQEKLALAYIGRGSVSEGIRISVRWAHHFWRVGLRPDNNLDHVGICLFVEDDLEDDL